METLVRLLTRHSVAVLVVIGVLSAVFALRLPLDYDDDVVRFLPQDDPEVQRFNRIMERFGSLQVALVGVEAPDLYTHDVLTYVRKLGEHLRALPEVAFVTDIAELAVIQGEAEAEHRELLPKPVPEDAAGLAAVREFITSLDYLSGVMVSADGTSTMLIVQLRGEGEAGAGLSTKKGAEAVRRAAAELTAPPGVELHFGGAPFIAEAAANGSQEDLRRLAPWVCLVIVVLIVLSLGSLHAALLTLGCVGLGILWTMGLMGWLGQPLTLVSSSLPVILVALGSAYAVHLLVYYLEHDADVDAMLRNVGGPVIVAALTTVAGFISFLVMDLAPMREFGWQMAMGTAICALVALTLIPAVLSRWPIPARGANAIDQRLDDLLVGLARLGRRRRVPILVISVAIAGFFATQLPYIETRMGTRSFFEEGSPPERADRFMTEEFGGSIFLQVLVTGDIQDPAVLHRVAAFEDRLRAIPEVTRVESISKVLSIVHEGLKGTRKLSTTRKEIEHFGFLATRTDPAVRLLVDEPWSGALVQVGIGGFDTGIVQPVTQAIRRLAAEHLDGYVGAVPRSDDRLPGVLRDAAERIAILAGLGADAVPRLEAALGAGQGDDGRAVRAAVGGVLTREVAEDEMVEVREDADLDALADAVAADALALRFQAAGFVARLEKLVVPDELEDREAFERAARYVATKIDQAVEPLVTRAVHERVDAIAGEQPAAVKLRVAAIVDEVMQPVWYLASPTAPAAAGAVAPPPLAATVSGYPILQEAMTQSVQRNQQLSVAVSMPLVLLILVVVFRSFVLGFIGLLPSGLTLLVTFGLMGLMPSKLPMDIAASMLASIALGVGIDYAIHFMWRWRVSGIDGAMRTTGRSIVINAAEITAGFVILAWASIVPMAHFGLLTAETLLVAAAATLLLLPALLEGREGDRSPPVDKENPDAT